MQESLGLLFLSESRFSDRARYIALYNFVPGWNQVGLLMVWMFLAERLNSHLRMTSCRRFNLHFAEIWLVEVGGAGSDAGDAD